MCKYSDISDHDLDHLVRDIQCTRCLYATRISEPKAWLSAHDDNSPRLPGLASITLWLTHGGTGIVNAHVWSAMSRAMWSISCTMWSSPILKQTAYHNFGLHFQWIRLSEWPFLAVNFHLTHPFSNLVSEGCGLPTNCHCASGWSCTMNLQLGSSRMRLLYNHQASLLMIELV